MPQPFRNANTGEIETYPDLSEAQRAALIRSRPELRPALPEEVEAAAKYREHSTALEQLKAAGELGVATASLGTIASDSPEAKARREAFRQESPIISTAVEQGAALAPALAVGALTGGAGAALGLSAARAGALSFAAESVTLGTTIEAEHAREEARDIDVSNILQGLALDVATAGVGRLARGIARRGSRAADAVDDLEQAAESPATGIARANRISKERRSVGAAGAKDPTAKPPERAEVQDYARNGEFIDADVDELGYNAINDAIGGDAPAFREVHKISLKRGDVLGRMTDADEEAVLDFVITQTERAEALAQKLERDGAKGAAATIRDHIQRAVSSFESDNFVEDAAISLDQMKRTLDDYRSRFGSYGTKATDPLRERVQWVDDVLDPKDQPLRRGLEDRKTWGKLWADKQLEENRLWSGSDSSQLSGLINTSKVWQRAFAEPHAGIKVRSGLEDVPVFKSKGDLVKIAKSMNDRDFDEVMNAFDTWIDKAKQMNAIKAELGVDSISRTPIARLETALDRMQSLSVELKQIRKLDRMAEPIRKHIEKMGEGKALAQTLYEGARELPGVGQAIKAGENIPGVREKISNFLEPQPAPLRGRPTADEALTRIGERQRKRREGWMSARAMSPRERAEAFIRQRKTRAGGGQVGVDTPQQVGLGESQRGAARDVQRPDAVSGVDVGHAPKNGPVMVELNGKQHRIDFSGKSASDLGISDIDATSRQSTLEALRNDPQFRRTGRPTGTGPADEALKGIKVELYPDGSVYIRDGSHRFGVARELNLPTIRATVYEGSTQRVLAEGVDIPMRAPEAPSPQPSARGFTELGAMAGAGGLGILGASTFLDNGDTPMTDALAELADHSRAIMDRAALGLMVPESRAPRLPSVAERFKGDAPDLRAAFANVLDMLQTAHSDPAAFVEAMTEAYGDVGSGGHEDLAQRVIARTTVAVEYLLANLPPNLATSVTRPDGAPIDPLAVAEFAKLWSGAMRPGDVIYDVGAGTATPTQIRALREVHPDIYTNLRISVIRALGEARAVPFETKRKLDVLFDIDGAAGASFSSAFTKTMATARADKAQTSQSLGGESVVAPQSANQVFSSGPTAIR